MEDLLVEIGCEELPPKALKSLGSTFGANVEKQLNDNRFAFSKVRWLASPRRLSVIVEQLVRSQKDVEINKKGPSVKAAYDAEGNPTKAAIGWAKSNGINVSDATIIETPKGQWLQTTIKERGKNIDSCLSDMLVKALNALPVPKMMRWGNNDFQFVRPVHNICCLYGNTPLSIELFGVKSSNFVLGHRFHSSGLHELNSAQDYQTRLKALKVVASFDERKSSIKNDLASAADSLNADFVADDALLEEVASLVEWPVVLQAEFDCAFLEVPKEPLIYTMKDDQKYFALLDKNTRALKNQFLFVSNIKSTNEASIIEGNQRVVRPRLADARFFYNSDLKVSNETRLNSLKHILFQKGLGSVHDKAERIAFVSEKLCGLLDGDNTAAKQAATLCKSDLVSNVVYEFPEVQGVMGYYYAKAEGLTDQVAEAIRDHYLPRHATDSLPQNVVSQSVAIADRIDTLVGIFSLGQTPKGDKDPFGLRRAVLGITRIVFGFSLKVNLEQIIDFSLESYGDVVNSDKHMSLKPELVQFFNTRLENYFVESGISVNLCRSVIAVHSAHLNETRLKIDALSHCLMENIETMESLIASNKRISNILSKSTLTKDVEAVKADLLVDTYENRLFYKVKEFERSIDYNHFENSDQVSQYLQHLLQFKNAINDFFDNVMVNANDENIRTNRFALLSLLRSKFLRIADFSTLQG